MADAPVVMPPWVQEKRKEGFSNICFWLMKELHLSYQDIMDMPVPAILGLLKEMDAYAKAQERHIKKVKRKK
jgi:hypothetical protein